MHVLHLAEWGPNHLRSEEAAWLWDVAACSALTLIETKN